MRSGDSKRAAKWTALTLLASAVCSAEIKRPHTPQPQAPTLPLQAPPPPPPPDYVPFVPPRPDWRQLVDAVVKPGDVAALYQALLRERYAELRSVSVESAPLPAEELRYDPLLTQFHLQGPHAGTWVFFNPREQTWPTQALHLVDRSNEFEYRVTEHLFCEDDAAACATLREHAAQARAPEPDTSFNAMSYRQWEHLVMHETCTPGPVQKSPPPYPLAAVRAGIEGTTVVRILVNPCGEVRAGSVYKSSGNRELDRSAVKTVRRWRVAEHSMAALVGIDFRIPQPEPEPAN